MEGRIINIRAFAILLVVLGHSIIIYDPEWGLMGKAQTSELFIHIKSMINFIQMKLFFSVSGYLMYYSMDRSKGFCKFIKAKSKRLLLPYCFIALLWMDPIKILIGVPGYDSITSLIKAQIVGENSGHLWYVIALFVIFVFAYCLIKVTVIFTTWLSSKGLSSLKLPTTLVIFVLLNILPTPGTNILQLDNACRYLPYFYFGYLVNAIRHSQIIKIKHRCLQLATILICVTILTTYLCTEGRIATFITTLLLSYSLIAVVYVMFPERTNKVINYVSQNSYGLYLLHSPLVYITFKLIPDWAPVIVFAVNFFVFGGFALVLSNYIRKTRLAPVIGG